MSKYIVGIFKGVNILSYTESPFSVLGVRIVHQNI